MRNICYHRFSTFSRSSLFLPLPHVRIPEAKGHDLDVINITHSHLIHSHWNQLHPLLPSLTPFTLTHILLKLQFNHTLSFQFYNWVLKHKPISLTLQTHSILLHILTKARNFKTAQSILINNILISNSIHLPSNLFHALLHSYRLCHSSPLVFDSLFNTFAHLNKLRYATYTFNRMKEYGFFPTVQSCNAYISSLLKLHRSDIVIAFYRELLRDCISPNVYTINMVICAYCKIGELQKASEMLDRMKEMGLSPNVVSFNTLISGYCKKGLLGLAMKVYSLMERNEVPKNVVTFNTLINGFCKEGKLHEANKIFNEMKASNVAPDTVTYNTLINGYSQVGKSEMGNRIYEEMARNEVKADILTYNALILGLCKEGKTKKAAYLVKELDDKNLVPNASTFSALITGQCTRKNSEHAFLIYKSMIRSGCNPNEHTFQMLISAFCKNEDFDGAVQVMRDMLDRVMTPNSTILFELFSGLCKCGRNQSALSLLNEMEAKHLLPEGFDKENIAITHPENQTNN